jgi:hypothetical protein
MHDIAKRVAIAGFLAIAPCSALADAIDGEWCSEDGGIHFTIAGPRVTTPAGTRTTGDYSRHAFSYVVPTGDPGAGNEINMLLLNENEVQVLVNGDAPEIWRRCQLNA